MNLFWVWSSIVCSHFWTYLSSHFIFLVENKTSELSRMNRSTLLFCENSLHDNVYYDEYCSCFLWRELLEQLFFREWNHRSISYSSPFSKSLSLSETLYIRVLHTWKIINWMPKAIMSVEVVSRFMYAYLPKSTSFELSRGSVPMTLCTVE